MSAEFHPPFTGNDEYTAVLVRKSLSGPVNVSDAVREPLLEQLTGRSTDDDYIKAWKTTCNRIAAVKLESVPSLGGKSVLAASLHCSRSSGTPDLVVELLSLIRGLNADVFVIGLDTNISGDEVVGFEKRLKSLPGVDFGNDFGDQITVAKQRTIFQTQTEKAGNTDVSHKDYLLTGGLMRGTTHYSPDLHTSFGMDRSTGELIRLPTTQWPFDHCAVATELLGGVKTPDAEAEMVDAKGSRAWKTAVFAVWVASFFVVLAPLAVDLYGHCRDRNFVNAELSKAGGMPGAFVEEVELQQVSFEL